MTSLAKIQLVRKISNSEKLTFLVLLYEQMKEEKCYKKTEQKQSWKRPERSI